MKATLANIRQSRFPNMIGVGTCANDPRVVSTLNECIQRLINAAGETGWYGGWQKVAFNVSRANPYITLPRQIARVIGLDVCKHPITLHNEFYEFLPGGVGLKGINLCQPDWCGVLDGYERPSVPTMVDITATNQLLRTYITDPRDIGKRMLVQGTDQNGLQIYTMDGVNTVDGLFITFATPFADSIDADTGLPIVFNSIQSILKDTTYGDVVLKQVDATTGAEVTLSRYAPDETNPSYRRYYIESLPWGCCPGAATTVTVTAIAKLEFIPVSRETDQLIIGNIPALIEEAQAIRYSEMDVPNAAKLEAKHEAKAIRLLQNEQRHYEGEQMVAINYDIFQGSPLERQGIGTNI